MDVPETKQCKTCGKVLPLDSYSVTPSGKGRKRSCKCCVKAARDAWLVANADKVKAIKRKHYEKVRDDFTPNNSARVCVTCKKFKEADQFAEKSVARCKCCKAASDLTYRRNNKEKLKVKAKEYYWSNRENQLAYSCAWQRANPERVAIRNNKWAAKNKGKLNAYVAKRRAQKFKATPAWADPEKIKGFYDTSQGLSMLLGEWYEVDHIVPLQSDIVCGLHCEANLQVLLLSENRSKCNRWWPDMWEPE